MVVRIFFIGTYSDANITDRLKSARIEYIPIQDGSNKSLKIDNFISELNNESPDLVILDGYHFDALTQDAVRKAGFDLLVIDDFNHLDHYSANILLNQNLYAPDINYTINPDATLLLGTKYTIFRKEFLLKRNYKKQISEKTKNILVTMGGSDPYNVTLMVLKALELLQNEQINVKVITGPANKHLESVKKRINNSKIPCNVHQNAIDMTELMEWADIAITAAGSTCWELAYMGVPMVVIAIAENQSMNASYLGEGQYAINLGWYENLTLELIKSSIEKIIDQPYKLFNMQQRSKSLVDGYGIERIMMHIKNENLWIREALLEDCRLIWKWTNDPVVRGMSFTSKPIPWDDHAAWFNKKLNDPSCKFYIAIDRNENLVGQVRFDLKDSEAIISVSLDKNFRGMGFGSSIIKLGSERYFQKNNVRLIHAYIKSDNTASINAFCKAGYKFHQKTVINKIPAEDMIMENETI